MLILFQQNEMAVKNKTVTTTAATTTPLSAKATAFKIILNGRIDNERNTVDRLPIYADKAMIWTWSETSVFLALQFWTLKNIPHCESATGVKETGAVANFWLGPYSLYHNKSFLKDWTLRLVLTCIYVNLTEYSKCLTKNKSKTKSTIK